MQTGQTLSNPRNGSPPEADAEDLPTPTWNQAEIMGMLGHDLRTPLNCIQGFLELLAATNLTRQQTELLEAALSGADDLQCTLEGILECARQDLGHVGVRPSATDLRWLLKDAVTRFSALASANSVAVRLEVSARTPQTILIDETKVRQIVSNLLSNAVKFTPAGSISVRAAVILPLDGEEGLVQIMVEDTGIGMSPDQAERNFPAPAKPEAPCRRNGLGLAIVEKLVATMEGSMTIQSMAGVGTSITVRLPFGEC